MSAAQSWPHSLDNLQQCAEYVDRLKETTTDAFLESFPDEGIEKTKFDHIIVSLEQIKSELENLYSNHCKEGAPMFWFHYRLMLDSLGNLDYNIDEVQYEDFQVNDPFAKAFTAQAD